MKLVQTKKSDPAPKAVRLPTLNIGVADDSDTVKILDFDIETVAAGFADPNWVPQKITCVAWSWIGSKKVESSICGSEGLFGNPTARLQMIKQLLDQIEQADMVTGHNIERFDLPIINAECMRLGLTPIKKKRVQDTMRVFRSKGFKKGQGNLGRMLKTRDDKLHLDWQHWQDAYDEEGWKTIRKRAESDVAQHKEIRTLLLERKILKDPRDWFAT